MIKYKPHGQYVNTLSSLAVVRPFATKRLRCEEYLKVLELRALRLPRRRPQKLLAALRREKMINYETAIAATL